MKGYAVCGLQNDLSEPVDSVWTDIEKAEERRDFLNAADRKLAPTISHYGTHWKVREFDLDTPDQNIN